VELKFAGCDVLIIEGKAEKPTYVWIKDGKVQSAAPKGVGHENHGLPADHQNELNDQNVRIACIGPAGET